MKRPSDAERDLAGPVHDPMIAALSASSDGSLTAVAAFDATLSESKVAITAAGFRLRRGCVGINCRLLRRTAILDFGVRENPNSLSPLTDALRDVLRTGHARPHYSSQITTLRPGLACPVAHCRRPVEPAHTAQSDRHHNSGQRWSDSRSEGKTGCSSDFACREYP